MLDELNEQPVGTQPVVAPSVSTAPTATGEVKVEGTVDLPPDPAALQTEIDRLKSVREKAESDAKYWRQQKAEARADYFKSRQQEPQPPAPAAQVDLGIGLEPKKEDFTDYDAWIDAKLQWNVKKARVEWDRDLAKKQADTDHKEKMRTFQEKIITSGFQEFKDFEEVALDPAVPVTPVMAEIMAECEAPHKVAYYLGRNRTEAIKISKMNPIQAAREIAKIEVEIAKAATAPSVPPKLPGAPPPIKPVGSSHSIEKGPNQAKSQKEYEEWASQNPKLRRF